MLILGLASVASAGTMVISGLPTGDVYTTDSDIVLSIDIVSDGHTTQVFHRNKIKSG